MRKHNIENPSPIIDLLNYWQHKLEHDAQLSAVAYVVIYQLASVLWHDGYILSSTDGWSVIGGD